MVTDMRPKIKELKDALLGRPKPKDMIDKVLQNYFKRALPLIHEALQSNLSPEDFKTRKILEIEDLLQEPNVPMDPLKRRDYISEMKALATLTPKDGALHAPDIYSIDKKRSYKDKIDILRQAGMVVDSTSPHRDAETLADFELMVLDRSYELPQPLSQTIIKNPRKTNAIPSAIHFNWSLQKAFKKRTGYDFRTVRLTEGDSTKERKKKLKYLEFLGEAFTQEGIAQRSNFLLAKSREFWDAAGGKPQRDSSLCKTISSAINPYHEAAISAGEELPKANYLRLLPDNIAPGDLVKANLSARQHYDKALHSADPDARYIALTFKPSDRRRRIFMIGNAIAGLKLYLYSEAARELDRQGYTVKKSDIIDVRPYAGKSEGLVGSKSGIQQQYHTKVGPFTSHKGIKSTPKDKKKLSSILADCNCPDLDFHADLHIAEEHEHEYPCKHVNALAVTYIIQEEKAGVVVENPLPLPNYDLMIVQKTLEEQAFVERRIDGTCKPLNRGEQEPILISYAVSHPGAIHDHAGRAALSANHLYGSIIRQTIPELKDKD